MSSSARLGIRKLLRLDQLSSGNFSSNSSLLKTLYFILGYWRPFSILYFSLESFQISQTYYIKFRYCEKDTIFEKISHYFFLNYSVTTKQSGRFFQIFVACSEYLSFIEKSCCDSMAKMKVRELAESCWIESTNFNLKHLPLKYALWDFTSLYKILIKVHSVNCNIYAFAISVAVKAKLG